MITKGKIRWESLFELEHGAILQGQFGRPPERGHVVWPDYLHWRCRGSALLRGIDAHGCQES
jgi:hypothetical protein